VTAAIGKEVNFKCKKCFDSGSSDAGVWHREARDRRTSWDRERGIRRKGGVVFNKRAPLPKDDSGGGSRRTFIDKGKKRNHQCMSDD